AFSGPEPGPLSRRLFFAIQTMERRRGAREEVQVLRAPIAVVLAYRSTPDPNVLAQQLDQLRDDGWGFVELDRFLDAVASGAPLPPRSILVTFDDASTACTIVSQHRVPAVAFAVADGADANGLRRAAELGVAIGSHGATHRPLASVPEDEFRAELEGSADTLESLGLPRPSVFAYPHGQWTPAIAAAVEGAGYRAAFTLGGDGVRRLPDRYALPRIDALAAAARPSPPHHLRTHRPGPPSPHPRPP